MELTNKETNAATKLYDWMDLEIANVEDHLASCYLTQNSCDGKDVLHYYDGRLEGAIYVETEEILTKQEIEKYFD